MNSSEPSSRKTEGHSGRASGKESGRSSRKYPDGSAHALPEKDNRESFREQLRDDQRKGNRAGSCTSGEKQTSSLRAYGILTAAYWGFTLTDGALRMLVLLHFHERGYSPLDLAFLFLIYEAMGMVTNLGGGWLAARFGLRMTLQSGLALQIVALLLLSALQPDWSPVLSIGWIMGAQALSGIAKDLTKMSAKSGVKLVARSSNPEESTDSVLFRWVALLTGSKNALKGLGFFLGGLLLSTTGFAPALWIMAGGLSMVLLAVLVQPGDTPGSVKGSVKIRDVFSKSREINLLSLARFFLFGSRDLWFVVGLPLYLKTVLEWSFWEVGGFMAFWIIGYGFVQAIAPRLSGKAQSIYRAVHVLRFWSLALFLLPLSMGLCLLILGDDPMNTPMANVILIGGLLLYGVAFAVNSSLHSYMIVGYAEHGDVTLSVGFYYMANAAGRLTGTLLSGLAYMFWGLEACLLISALFIAIATGVSLLLPTEENRQEQAS